MKRAIFTLLVIFNLLTFAGKVEDMSAVSGAVGGLSFTPQSIHNNGETYFIGSTQSLGQSIYSSSSAFPNAEFNKTPDEAIVVEHPTKKLIFYADNLLGGKSDLFYSGASGFTSLSSTPAAFKTVLSIAGSVSDSGNIYVTFTTSAGLYYIEFSISGGNWSAGNVTEASQTSAFVPRNSFISKDGTNIYFLSQTNNNLYVYESGASTSLAVNVDSLCLSADSTTLFYTSNNNLYKASTSGNWKPHLIFKNFQKTGNSISCSEAGHFLTFTSNQLYGDANQLYGTSNAYMLDSVNGGIYCLSKTATLTVYDARQVRISKNGNYVTFEAKNSKVASDYRVFRYSVENGDLLTERVFSFNNKIDSDHGIYTSSDNLKTLAFGMNGASTYEPYLFNNLTGKAHALDVNNAIAVARYQMSLSGKTLLSEDTSGVSYYPINDDFTLGSPVEVTNSLTKAFSVDGSGKNVAYIENDNLYVWNADTKLKKLLSGAVANIDDTPSVSSLAFSANGNFAVCKKAGVGLVVFAKNSANQWISRVPSSLASVTTFKNSSVSRNGRILTYYDGADVKVFDFFMDDFINNSALDGSNYPFVSASGAEVIFVKSNVLKSFRLRATENEVKDIVTVAGGDFIGFSNIAPTGSSLTFVANSDALEGRDGKFDLYQYYFERNNSAPSGVEKSGTLKVDMLHTLDMKVVASDDYDMDVDVISVDGTANGSFDYLRFFDGKSTYQSDRGFSGTDTAYLNVVDSSGLKNRLAVDVDVLKSTLNFANGYIPDDPTGDGYDVALSLSSDLTTDLDLRDGGAVVSFDDPQFSDLRLSGDGSQIIVENVTALGYEDVAFRIDGVSKTVRLEYGRDFIVRTGWNMLGVPYEFTEAGFVALEQDLEAGWGWNGSSYISCIDEPSDRLKDIEKGSAYWLFHILPDGVYENGENATSLAPNKPAAYVSDLNSAENSNFFKVPLLEDKWRMISPVGYDEATTRRVSGAPVWGWDSENNVYNIPENSGGWKMHSLNGYWQFGFDGFSVKDVDEHGKAEVELKYDKSAE